MSSSPAGTTASHLGPYRYYWLVLCIFLLLALCTCTSLPIALVPSTACTRKQLPRPAFLIPRTCARKGTHGTTIMLHAGGRTLPTPSADRISFPPAGNLQSRQQKIPLWANNSDDDDEDDDTNIDSLDTGTTQGPPRIRAKFDRLFAGMPSMQDILRGGSVDDDDEDDNDNTFLAPKKKKRDVDDSWFQTEQQLIRANYDRILNDMLLQLADERRRDPEAIPENAEALIRSVLQQEMEREITQTRNDRMEEMMTTYEMEQRQANDALGSSELPPPSESVQQLMRESEVEFQQQEANRLEIEDFLRYEQEAVWKSNNAGVAAATEELENSGIRRPNPDEDLDRWALERLKEMAGAREDSDGDEMILDILQDNVQDLEDRIRKETSRTGAMLPETMKEWQMYRAIATRLTRGSKGGVEEEASREDEILLQLESWKDYIRKEEGIRRQSGLTRGPKMPFAWQEQDLFEREVPSPGASDKQSRINARKQLNRMSIEAMESLLSTTDIARRERLQKEIDFLKATLEENDYLDVDESYLEDTTAGTTPVDVSGLFQTSPKDDADLEGSPSSFIRSFDTSAQSSGTGQLSSYSFSSDEKPLATSPNTPGFEEEFENAPSRTVPPPNTAFFADFDDEEPDLGETFTGDSKLGTMEDQKLEGMYRRAGARTTEERTVMRKQWEEFQAFEKTRRDQSGLSGRVDDDIATAAKSLSYNIADVVREDGDVDAEAILAAIGPRPVRRKKGDLPDLGSGEGEAMDPSIEKEKKDVMNSLYRAVEAVGGGRYRDDPEAKAKQQAAFEQYMEKENAMRESLDDPNLPDSITIPSGDEVDIDDPEYADEVLSAIGSRPKPRKARKIDPGDYSDKGGILSSDDYDDIFDGSEDASDDDEDDETEMKDDGEGRVIPEWLKKENEESVKKESGGIRRRGSFLGSEIDEVFDDTDYEHNMRQLAEYEKRRAGRGRQMGIDISDVLGRSTFDTNDYADYKLEDASGRRGGDWGAASFASRKANLLEYIELDIMELNSLMDHKSSVYSTGVSQYLPRINKPFSSFGAIFRMEGVLLNIDGLQLKAWTKVASQFGYKAPTLDEVQQASLTRPEVAIKEIFFWTDDFLECRDVAFSHKQAFKEVFETWTDENGITVSENSAVENEKGSLAIGAVTQSSPQPIYWRPANEDEKLDLVSKAWAATAEAFGKKPPQREEIVVAASISPDIAVRQAFGWAVDPLEVDRIVYMYRRYLRAGSGKIDEATTTSEPSRPAPSPSYRRPLTQTDVMEMHYHAWNAVAESFGFDAPSPDEVLAAFVINEPEAAAEAFGWSDDPRILRDVASAFSDRLEVLKEGVSEVEPKTATPVKTTSTNSVESGPSQDEIFQVSFEAWRATARKNGFRDPDSEEVQFALTVGPDEAILSGFRWTPYPAEAARLVESYKSELAQRRPSWLKESTSSSSGSHSRSGLSESSRTTPGQPSADELYLAVFNAWTDTAKKLNFSVPDDEQVVFAMSVGAEEAVVTGFGWTDDRAEAREIVESYKVELSKRRSSWIKRGAVSGGSIKSGGSTDDVPMVRVNQGAAKWVKSLLDVEMQCGVVSYLERDQVNALLLHAGMDGLFPPDKRVSASNGYVTDKDQLLGAALRLERRPDHCVVFDSTPYASIAAHDVGMQSVSLIGSYPRYELMSADTTSSSFEDLTAMNIRRLFSERVYDQPLAESAQNQPEKRAVTKTRFFYDDD